MARHRVYLDSRPLVHNGAQHVDLEIVLCHLPSNRKMPYVTWRRSITTGFVFMGNYFKTLPEAQRDFSTRT